MRIVGYVIKGLFLLIKKYYDQIYKETQLFIEIHLEGKKKKIKEENSKTKNIETFSQNFSAISLNSDYSNLTQIIENRTSILY